MDTTTIKKVIDSITPDLFMTFLESYPDGLNVYVNDFRMYTCPLARMLRTLTPGHRWFVNNVVGIANDDGSVKAWWPLTDWMRRVIFVSDSLRESNPDATYCELAMVLQDTI